MPDHAPGNFQPVPGQVNLADDGDQSNQSRDHNFLQPIRVIKNKRKRFTKIHYASGKNW